MALPLGNVGVIESMSLSDPNGPSLKVTWHIGMPFVYAVPPLTEHTHLPAVKASIALTHQASKSCADYLAHLFVK